MTHDKRTSRREAMCVHRRHNLISYVLETAPRPGMHEIRSKPVPDGMRIRNKGAYCHG